MRLVRIRGFWQSIIISIGLSPIINYFFVFLTTFLGIYNQTTTFVFLVIELVLLGFLFYPIVSKSIDQSLNTNKINSFFTDYLNSSSERCLLNRKITTFLYLAFFFIAYGCVLAYLFIFLAQATSVFSKWDAVVSWDRWAVDWYSNRFPRNTWHYPQLMPANWSITYQFINDSRIKFFAKFYMECIEILTVALIFILGLIKRKAGYFFGVIIVSWLQFNFGSLGTGYMDTPVAFWGLLSIACLILAQNNMNEKKLIIFGAIFAAGAAIIKQAGLWMVFSYPFLLLLSFKQTNKRQLLSLLLKILLIDILLIVPWYGYKEFQIIAGIDSSEIQYVTTLASAGKTLNEVYAVAINLIARKMHNPFVSGEIALYILCLLMLLSIKDQFWRRLIYFVVIPFSFIWVFFFSYDYRNFNLIVPMCGLTAGMGLQNIFEFYIPKLCLKFFPNLFQPREDFSSHNIRPKVKLVSSMQTNVNKFFHSMFSRIRSVKIKFLLLPFLAIFLLPLKYSDSSLLFQSIEKQKAIGDAQLNLEIYKLYAQNGIDGKILTDYQILGALPELKDHYFFGYPAGENYIDQFNQPQVEYALFDNELSSPEVDLYLNELIKNSKIKVILKTGSYIMVTTCRGNCK